jgi:integrase
MTGKPTMRQVSEGVYARVDAAGKVRGYTGYVPDASKKSGKRSIGTFSKAKQAKDARAEELGNPKGPGVHGDETVKEFRERWEREFNRDNRTVTKKGHHYALNAFVAAYGHLKLRELADKHYDEVRSWGRTTTVGYMAVARKMLNDAIEDKKLARGMNPLANLGRGKGRGRADITIITEDELYELADCAILALGSDFGPVFRGHILFSAHTAIRPSEARALMDVHVRPPELDVFDNYGDDSEKTTPKNGKRQTVACLPPAVAALAAMPANPASPYCFYGIRGQRLTKGSQHGYWDKTRKAMAAKTGDPKWHDIDFYEVTRHYCGSWMYNELRLPADMVAKQLRHADSHLIETLYGHMRDEVAIARIGDAFDAHARKRQSELARAEAPRLRLVR